MDSQIQVSSVLGKTNVSRNRVYFSLIMRTLLFFAFGLVIVGIFALSGSETPLKDAEKWWPFQAILANIATFFFLRNNLRTEGLSYVSIFNFKKGRGKKDVVETLWLTLVGLIIGGVSLFLFAFLLFGSLIPPDTMFQELPIWALIVVIILFPISNGLVETPTYIGYALPRIHTLTGKLWLAIVLAGLGLALQHIALPIVPDTTYMLWRFLSFVPLAIVLGFIFTKTRRLLPIAIAHFFMDLQLALQLAFMIPK